MRTAEFSPQQWLSQRLQKLTHSEFAPTPLAVAPSPLPLLEWGRRYLPTHFRRPPSRMHRWAAEWLDTGGERGRRLNLLAPRGGAKSTVITLAYVLRAAVTAREQYVWIVSDTARQAAGHLENIRAELQDNQLLARDYPAAVGRGAHWRNQLLELRNGVVLEAIGTGQRVRGRRKHEHRPSLIVCDDLQSERHIDSPTERELTRRWFHGLLLRAGTRTTDVLHLATALHREALAIDLHRTPGWTSQIFSAIEQWPKRMDLWQQWEALYCRPEEPAATEQARAFFLEHRLAMEHGATLLWPEEEDLYTLMRQRAESGKAAFDREKQNEPSIADRGEWPVEYFPPVIWFDRWPTDLRVRVLAVDPSQGHDARRGDYSAIVWLGVDSRGVVWFDADLARRPLAQLIADIVTHAQEWRPDVIGLETNQYRELLAGELAREFAARRLPAPTITPVVQQTAKSVRIRRWGPLLAQHRVRFRNLSPGARLLVEQLQDFPLGAHDDGPDAGELALRLAAAWLGRSSYDDGLGDRLIR